MRDPNRIRALLRFIEKIWTENPGLRLGQLIDNTMGANSTELYYIEDAELQMRLMHTYNKREVGQPVLKGEGK
jgi:hypothetical protein